MTPVIRLLSGQHGGPVYQLTENEIAIGREPTNQISIADPLISRRHCKILKKIENGEEQYLLIDGNSINGTEVNGDRVKERWLSHGDVIRIGKNNLLFLCHENEDLISGDVTVDVENDNRPTVALDRGESIYLNENPKRSVAIGVTPADQLIKDFQKLIRIGLELNSEQDPENLQRRLFELIGDAIPAERGAVILIEPGSDEIRSIHNWHKTSQPTARLKVSHTILKGVISSGQTLLSNDVATNTALHGTASLYQSGIRSILAAPMKAGARVLGVIYLDSRSPTSQFSETHGELLTAIAEVAATAYTNAQEMVKLQVETRLLKDELNFERVMVGESAPMIAVQRFISVVAPTDSTVLIRGESGTGKEIVARAIHQNSPRANKAFVAINCAVLDEALLASELFGHEKGAFTGATQQKKGKLELADGGTVFLDEVGELAQELQAKLLRVLQEREIERVGGARPIKIDIRLIGATNKNLEAAIKRKEFREDLYYRLNVFSVTMPPLRDRQDDIPLLAKHFLDRFNAKSRPRVKDISREAYECLKNYDWPGNVRELENTIERAAVFASTDTILPDDLPDYIVESMGIETARVRQERDAQADRLASMRYHEALKQAKKQIILNAVKEADGDPHQAAKILDLHVNNLYRHIRELGLKDKLKNQR